MRLRRVRFHLGPELPPWPPLQSLARPACVRQHRIRNMVLPTADTQNTCDGKPMIGYTKKAWPRQRSGFGKVADRLPRALDRQVGQVPTVHSSDVQCRHVLRLRRAARLLSTLSKIPRGRLAQWVMNRLSSKRLTKEQLQQLEVNDQTSIVDLFSFEVQLAATTMLPKECEDEVLANLMFTARADEVGPRVEKLISDGGLNGGAINFGKGCFKLTFDESNTCTEISHIIGVETVPPPHVTIPREFVLSDNHISTRAPNSL